MKCDIEQANGVGVSRAMPGLPHGRAFLTHQPVRTAVQRDPGAYDKPCKARPRPGIARRTIPIPCLTGLNP